MLSKLYIENVAVIEKTEVDFGTGLNILTGETGAGKSIVIDSIGAILGQRIFRDIVRTGSDSAFISATFTSLSKNVSSLIEDLGYKIEDDALIIQREINPNGKGACKINGRPSTVSTLKQITSQLINIHGQHETYDLFSAENHLKYIDKMGKLDQLLYDYKVQYEDLKNIKSQIDHLEMNDSEKARRIDLLKYQIEELEDAALIEGEEEELLQEKNVFVNKEKIVKSLSAAKNSIFGNDESPGALSLVEQAVYELNDLVEIFEKSQDIHNRLRSLSYELGDCQLDLSNLLDEADIDTGDIDAIEERLALISSLSRKYGATISDMLVFLESAKQELQNIEFADQKIKELKAEFELKKDKTKAMAFKISEARKKVSDDFIKAVQHELIFLDMPKVKFEVSQKRVSLNPTGCDELEFLISTNPGEPPKPISKIASGGELSRFMLAIKNVLSGNDEIETMIFDEIDTGISGSAAQKVGLKLKNLAHTRQIICVTHLAQIASLADKHFSIAKNISGNRTFTDVKVLSYEERKKELARIIGGLNITDLTLKNAEEMLILAQAKLES